MKNRRIFTLLTIIPILSACSGELPRLNKMDVSDTVAIFFAIPYKDEATRKKRDTDGISFRELDEEGCYFKIDKNGVASRVNFETSRSDNDDKIIRDSSRNGIANFNDDYFLFFAFKKEKEDLYLVDKKTGETIYLEDTSLNFVNLETYESPYYKTFLQKDYKGNIYTTLVGEFDIDSSGARDGFEHRVVMKLSINDGLYKEEILHINDNYLSYGNNVMAVDKEGNFAICEDLVNFGEVKADPPKQRYITKNGDVIIFESEEYTEEEGRYYSNKHYFQGYDGEIYTNEKNNICKIVPIKDNNGKIISINQEPLFELPEYVFKAFGGKHNLLYINETNTIILCEYNKNCLEFYSIYGRQAGEKIFSFQQVTTSTPYYCSKDSFYVRGENKLTRFCFLNEPKVESTEIKYISNVGQMTQDNKFVFKLYEGLNANPYFRLRKIGFHDFETNETKIVENMKFDSVSDWPENLVAF